MGGISSGNDFEESESLTDAVSTARSRILDTYPEVQTVHFWINQNTQRVRCEIALPKPGAGQHGKPSTQAILGIIDEIIAPTLSPKKRIPPVVKFNIGVPTDISPVVSPIDKLTTVVGGLLKKLVPPPSRANGNNASEN